nr:hypothetical protein [Sphaerochaeta halotolerans]
MKGINIPGQAMDSGGVSSFSAPRDGVSHLAFPALAPERNHHADSFPLAPLGNELLVRYGQLICTPVSPFCSKCPQAGHCPKIGVQRSR